MCLIIIKDSRVEIKTDLIYGQNSQRSSLGGLQDSFQWNLKTRTFGEFVQTYPFSTTDTKLPQTSPISQSLRTSLHFTQNRIGLQTKEVEFSTLPLQIAGHLRMSLMQKTKATCIQLTSMLWSRVQYSPLPDDLSYVGNLLTWGPFKLSLTSTSKWYSLEFDLLEPLSYLFNS